MKGTAGHLTEDQLKAVAQGRRAGFPLRHLLSCPTCRDRLKDLAGPAFRALEPVFEMPPMVTLHELASLERAATLEVRAAKERVLGFLASRNRNTAQLTEPPISPYTLALVTLRFADDLRLRDVEGLQALCQHLCAEIPPDEGLWMAEVLARLKAELANCFSIRGDLCAARPIILEALVECPQECPLSQGIVKWLAALHFVDAQDYDAARQKCDEALSEFTSIDEVCYAGRVKYLQAKIYFFRGDLAVAARRLEQLRKQPLDEFTQVAVIHLLAKTLVFQEEYFVVGDLLRTLRSLLGKWSGYPVVVATTQWLQALYLGGTRSPDLASEKLAEIAETFIEQELPLETALVRVDQAFFELQASKMAEATETASQALSTLMSHQAIYPDFFAALRVLVESLRSGELERPSFRELRLALEHARYARVGRNGGSVGE